MMADTSGCALGWPAKMGPGLLLIHRVDECMARATSSSTNSFEGSYWVDSMCGLRKDVRGLLCIHPFSLGGPPS